MGASVVVVGRETLEASLLIGFLLAYLAHTGNRRYFVNVWIGVGLAASVSVLLAMALLVTAGQISEAWEETLEGAVMWAAAGVLTYVLWWMGHQSRQLSNSLEIKV